MLLNLCQLWVIIMIDGGMRICRHIGIWGGCLYFRYERFRLRCIGGKSFTIPVQ